MKSVITSKFQTTVPKRIRETLKLSINDALEWQVEGDRVVVQPVKAPFLKYRNALKTGKGDISKDIKKARRLRAEGAL